MLIGFAIIAVIIVTGWGIARFGVIGPEAHQVLSRLAFFVLSPALLFTVLAEADLHALFSVQLAVALKLLVMPLVAWAAARYLFGLDGHELFVAVVLAALPTAQNVFVYASRYGRGETLARDAVLLSTLLALPVIVVVAWLL